MPGVKAFVDTNVLIYLLSADAEKADRAESVVNGGCVISVQVLNEMANVARRKLALPWGEIKDILGLIRAVCPVEPLTPETHEKGLALAARYGYSIYDAIIVAAALLADCEVLYSEEMQHGQQIEQLRICNPFI